MSDLARACLILGATVCAVSRAMLYLKNPEGDFTNRWGDQAFQRCKVRYALPDAQTTKPGASVLGDVKC